MISPRASRWTPVIAAAALSVAARHRMNADGLSYLDMAANGQVFHGYWSPLLAVLLRPAAALGPDWEFAGAHVIICLGFLAASWGLHRIAGDRPFLHLLLFYAAARLVSFTQVTPDMLVLATVLIIVSETRAVWLGVWLALGFLAKSVMLPAGVLFLLIRRRFLWAGVIFAVLSAGPIWRISRAAGHLTIGDSGRLNYAWFVNGQQPYSGWIKADEHGTPKHPPRVLVADPPTIEYSGPVAGTYPLWYDPAYWYSGTRTPIHPGRLMKAIVGNIQECVRLFFIEAAPITGAILALAWFARGRWSLPREKLWMILWPVSMIALYCCVLVESRYLAPFLIVLWIALFEAFRPEPAIEKAILTAAAIAILLPLSARSIEEIRDGMKPPEHRAVADALRAAGIGESDRLAAIGLANDYFAARVLRARIVAEVRDPDLFWTRPADTILEAKLAALGVKAILGVNRPKHHPDRAWQKINNTSFSIKALR